jgi:hypothetical protein
MRKSLALRGTQAVGELLDWRRERAIGRAHCIKIVHLRENLLDNEQRSNATLAHAHSHVRHELVE